MRRLGLLGWLLLATACQPAPTAGPRLAVLVVDGLDPDLLDRLLSAGRLPHLAVLAQASGVVRVTSVPGAESASAWASLATGTNPGAHGVFDAVMPDPSTGRPVAATLRPRPSATWFGAWPREGAAYAPVRAGPTFWTTLGQAGYRSRILFVPGTFPPEDVPAGSVIAGTPLPDWAGGWGSSYTWLGSDVLPEQVGFTRYGGRVDRLVFNRTVAHATLVGIRRPRRIDVPLTIAWNPEDRSANITIGDATVHLNEGQRSRWITIAVRLTALTRVQGLVRVHLVKAGTDVQLYVSPIQWHPVSSPSATAAPPGAAPALFGRIGAYRTLAWPEAAWAVADGWLPDETVETARDETFADRAAAILSQAESSDWDLLVAGVETANAPQMPQMPQMAQMTQMAQMPQMAQMGSVPPTARLPATRALVREYERVDMLVGELRKRIPPGAALAVMSPRGSVGVTRRVDLNRWLTTRGALVWRTPPSPVTLAALADPDVWPDTVDWSRSIARAMGSGHIFINRRDRFPAGIVEPGPDVDRARQDLREALQALVDPASGRSVVAAVRPAQEAYAGPHLAQAPDLVVTWAAGYAGTWDSFLGGLASQTILENGERWGAAHDGLDERLVPGVWLSSLPVTPAVMSLLDVAPTVLQYFGQPVPPGMEGRPQLRSSPSSASRR